MNAKNHTSNARTVLDHLDEFARRRKHVPFYALHVGKTHFGPVVEAADLYASPLSPAPHEYAPPIGLKELRECIASYQRNHFGLDVTAEQVLVTCGATHALSCAVKSVAEPGSEAIMLSPQWLFAPEVIHGCGVQALEAPVFIDMARSATFDLVSVLETLLSERTRAVYFNSPNNPSGYSLTRQQLQDLIGFAEHHDLWLLADNVYEHFDFSTQGFMNVACLARGAQRTLSIHSFSKSFSMAGYRVGYVIVPPAHVAAVQQHALASIYSVSTFCQHAAIKALQSAPSRWQEQRYEVKAAMRVVAEQLTVPALPAQGGFYRLLDLSDLSESQVALFVKRCLDAGVSLTPGAAFGRCCTKYARMCFTSVHSTALKDAIAILNRTYSEIRSTASGTSRLDAHAAIARRADP